MLLTLSAATFLLLLVTLLPVWRNPHWLVRGMDFPRMQFATLALVLLVAELIFLDNQDLIKWALLTLTLFCLVWQLCWVVPYTSLWPVEVLSTNESRTDRQLSIITSNVLMTNRNAEALLALVKKHAPDVLVTLESDQWWQDQLDILQPEMPYSIKCPLDNLYGMHVYSRLPLEQAEIKFLVETGVPSIHALLRLESGDLVRVHFLHPAPPSPTENPESAERDAELVVVARSIENSNQPIIVTGDLNDVAWSATTRLFRKLSGLLDPRVGRGMFNTFHADFPFVRWPLDHLFHSEHFTLRSIQRLPPIGSDHFALLTELSLTPQQSEDQQGLEADSADYLWAKSIVKSQNVNLEDVPKPGE